ncbi:MAG: hypothetical protein V5B36_13155 [Candidatus Accumulibacter sp. UW25]
MTPEDGLAIDGPHAGSAQFRDGELLQAVPFALRALPESAGEYGVHVEFHHAGARLYEFRLPIIVLPPGKALPAVVSPLAIDLDARQAVQAAGEVGKSPRRFRLKACFENNLLYLNLTITSMAKSTATSIEGFASSIDRARLRRPARATGDDPRRQSLREFLGVGRLRRFRHHGARRPARQLTSVTGQFAQAGGVLYRALREDAKMREILDYIEAQGEPGTRADDHHPRGIAGLGIACTRSASIPTTRTRWPLQPGLFWGARFALETQLLGEGDYAALLKAGDRRKAAASLNLNPTITSPPISRARFTTGWPRRCGRSARASKSMTTARAFATWWSRRRPTRR